MSDRFTTCSQCPREMNVMDEHENCFRHRDCNEGSPCDICKDWTPEGWSSIRKMVEKAIARANKPATITSPPPESRSEETRVDVQVSFMGNVGTLQSQRQPQVPFMGNRETLVRLQLIRKPLSWGDHKCRCSLQCSLMGSCQGSHLMNNFSTL